MSGEWQRGFMAGLRRAMQELNNNTVERWSSCSCHDAESNLRKMHKTTEQNFNETYDKSQGADHAE